MRVLIGSAFGVTSPVTTFAPTVYLDVQLAAGVTWVLPALAEELAVYPVDADIAVDGAPLAARSFGVLAAGTARPSRPAVRCG